MEQASAEVRDHDCLGGLIAAGFGNFEISIPCHGGRSYLLVLCELDGEWNAAVEDAGRGHQTMAEGSGGSAAEALWNVTRASLGGMPWEGQCPPGAIPARLIAQAAVLRAAATGPDYPACRLSDWAVVS